jgi:hypothetical protein
MTNDRAESAEAAGTVHTVHLIVQATQTGGPDTDWEDVSAMVARQIERVSVSMRNGAAFDLSATVDAAGEDA